MIEELIKAAIEASKNSYAPVSHFNVGAALLTDDNKVYLGCNIENRVLTFASSCAERTAIYKAMSEGKRKFKAIAIVGGYNHDFSEFSYPCGDCRQALREFCDGDFKIYSGNSNLEYKEFTLDELLPYSHKIEG